jgi:hypothetical protein
MHIAAGLAQGGGVDEVDIPVHELRESAFITQFGIFSQTSGIVSHWLLT